MVPKDLHFTEKDQTIINQPDQATGQEAYEIGKSYLYHYRDEQKAFEWFRRAASLGNQDARVYLDEINQYN